MVRLSGRVWTGVKVTRLLDSETRRTETIFPNGEIC
jgi:hypothetical protein